MKIDSIRVGFIATNCYLLCDEETGVCALIDPGDKPEQVADIIEATAEEGGADGFHFRVKVGDINYLTEIVTKLMPILRRRGLARDGYAGPTLRENLFAF